MKLKILVCKVLFRETYLLAATSPHTCDVRLLPQALHSEPEKLRRTLQVAIDEAEEEDNYDAILLGYGLCCNGIAGLQAHHTPLIVPRAHDCITLLLGSQETYLRWFARGGIYWYSTGWIEQAVRIGRETYDGVYEKYVEKYGEDNAKFLMDMERSWMKDYHEAIYVHWPQFANLKDDNVRFTQDIAEYNGWEYTLAEGSDAVMRDFMHGNWDNKDFLTVPPGMVIIPTYREDIIAARPPVEWQSTTAFPDVTIKMNQQSATII